MNQNVEYLENVTVDLPTKYGHFKLLAFNDDFPNCTFILYQGNLDNMTNPVVRVHSECLTGDVFGSLRCDCGQQLVKTLQLIDNEHQGIIVYLRQEGRGIGLFNKLKAYKLQEQGLDTVEANLKLGFGADQRNYEKAIEILKSKNINKVRLVTNNPDKIDYFKNSGIEITEVIDLKINSCEYNKKYFKTKVEKFGHKLIID